MKWKDIKVGQKLKDGSTVTQVHKMHNEPCCKVIYDEDRELICSWNHILLADVSKLSKEGKEELDSMCSFVPLEENYVVDSNDSFSPEELLIVQQYLENTPVPLQVDIIQDGKEEIYDFHFDTVKRVTAKNVITKSEPQKVDENTYWLTCKGIKYLMDKYNVMIYCNTLEINAIEDAGNLPCFCISTDTGKYET